MPDETIVIAAGFLRALASHDRGQRAGLLERVLSRGELRAMPELGPTAPLCRWQAMLLEAVDPALDAADYASGPVSWFGARGEPAPGLCLHATPVYLATLADRLALGLPDAVTSAESDELSARLAAELDSPDLRFAAVGPGNWFVHCGGQRDMKTTRLEVAREGDLRESQPVGADAALLRRVMTEAQMVLHEHPVNMARSAAGRRPVNGFWPWGGGCHPPAFEAADAALLGDDDYVRGIGRLANVPAGPGTFDALGSQQTRRVVLVTPVDSLGAFERTWLAPLVAGLQRGACRRLLLGLEQQWVSVTARQLRRFWKRDRPLGVVLA